MKEVAWMAGVSVAAWLLASVAIAGPGYVVGASSAVAARAQTSS